MTNLPPPPIDDKPGTDKPGAPDAADVASAQRVFTLRQQYSDKTTDDLVDLCIRNYCMQVASKGAANAGLAILPSLSIIGALAVGSLANQLNAVQQSQAELVLDIATIYGYRFRPKEKPYYLAVALGASMGNNQDQRQRSQQSAAEDLLAKGGQQLAQQATQRLARSTVGRALPVVNVTRAVGSNVLMTYTAGQRARTYIKTGPASVGPLEQSIGTTLKLEELKLSEWTQESLAATMANLSDTLMEGFDQGAQQVGRAAGRATRKLINFWRNATTPKT
ncbi:MAG: hypothetical protein R3E79_55005 [Caldilineaceae bacterium]